MLLTVQSVRADSVCIAVIVDNAKGAFFGDANEALIVGINPGDTGNKLSGAGPESFQIVPVSHIAGSPDLWIGVGIDRSSDLEKMTLETTTGRSPLDTANHVVGDSTFASPGSVFTRSIQESAAPSLWRTADANDDGHVTVGDLGILASHFNQTLPGGRSVGDFNLDGSVTVGDLGIIASYFNQSAPDSRAVTAVPVPPAVCGGAGLLAFAGALMFLRRRAELLHLS